MRYFVLTLFLLTALIAGAQAPAIKNADSLFAIGNYAKAIKAYSDLKQPTSKSELNIARAYKAQGNSKKALDFYTNVVAKYPELVIAKYEYAKLLLSSKNISDAEKHFFELTHQYPTNPEFHFQLGRVLKRKATLTDSLKFKLLNTAKLAFAKAYTLDTTSLKAAYETSKILLLQGKYSAGEKIALQALKIDSTHIDLVNVLAHNYHKRGYYRDAIVFWEKLLSLGQQNENIYKKLGYNYYERGEIDHAIKNYLSALAYNANDPKTHMQLGRLYNRKKDFVNAKTHLQQAITLLNPSLRDPYYTMALTYRIKEKWNLALQYINLAIKEDPGFIQGYYVKAQIADQYYKDRAEVIACYDKVISLSEGNANWEYYKILSKERVSRIKEEIFLEKEAKE